MASMPGWGRCVKVQGGRGEEGGYLSIRVTAKGNVCSCICEICESMCVAVCW